MRNPTRIRIVEMIALIPVLSGLAATENPVMDPSAMTGSMSIWRPEIIKASPMNFFISIGLDCV